MSARFKDFKGISRTAIQYPAHQHVRVMHKDVYRAFAVPVKTRVNSLSKGKGMASHLLLHPI